MMSCINATVSSDTNNSQIPVVVRAAAQPLRTWRLTRDGLVEVNNGDRMGAFLDKPKTAKTNTSGEGNGLKYAVASMQGWRVDMEDAHIAEVLMADIEPFKDWSFFAVFDGHAGNIAADDAAQNLMQTLIGTSHFTKVIDELKSTGGVLCPKAISLLEEGMKSGFLTLDEKIRTRLDQDRSGSTAVCAIVTPSHFIIANLGDSRAVIARKGESSFGTIDHKPYHEKERERIIGAGGTVMVQRINGNLAVSRAFGDFEYKSVPGLSASKQLVSPEPDVYVIERNPDRDEFLLLACDGIYDVMENDEVSNFIEDRLQVQEDLNIVCNEVLDTCLTKGSRDNMTVVLVALPAAPKIDPVKVELELKWKEQVTNAANTVILAETSRETWSSEDELNIDYVVRQIHAVDDVAATGPPHLLRCLVDQILTEKGIKHD